MRTMLPPMFRRVDYVLLGFVAALATLAVIAFTSIQSIARFKDGAQALEHTHWVIFDLEETVSAVKDADGAARGYYITGQESYLAPYHAAVAKLPGKLVTLRTLTQDDPVQQRNHVALTALVVERLQDLRENISLRAQANGASLVAARVGRGEGQNMMNRVRDQVTLMQDHEKALLAQRDAAFEHEAIKTRLIIVFGNLAAFAMLAVAFWFLQREVARRRASDTALKRANRELLQQAAQLEATNKELESFSYSISHDLRIPLRAVDGYAHMVEEDYADQLDDDGKRMLGVIRQNSTRMGNLIDDLLAFSRLGRTEITTENLDMNVIVAQVIAEVKGHADEAPQAAGATLTVDSLPHANGDRSLLQQVWTNLISNAVKYSAKSERPEIHVGGKREGDELVYSIRDNGAGFDMKYYDKLFGVFQRLHSADEFPGTGVGLAIVQRVVTRHGGRAWAEGKVGQGACFYFALPNQGNSDV